jgi:hypothetical protein
MKNTCTFFLALLFAVGGAFAQVPVESPATDIVVIGKSWRMEIRPSSAEEEDPFRANDEARQTQRDIKENNRRNEVRTRAGLPLEPPPIRVKPISDAPVVVDPSAVYLYEIKVKNTGSKTIRAIAWEYVFFDEVTKEEVGRRKFATKVNIQPGKTRNVTARSISPPTGTISAAQAGKKRGQYSEEIVIESIEYEDGTIR